MKTTSTNHTSHDKTVESSVNQNMHRSSPVRKKRSTLKFAIWTMVIIAIWIGAVQFLAADSYKAVVRFVNDKNSIGVNPLADKLDFGDLSPNTAAKRFITVENSGGMRIRVQVLTLGEISELMHLSRSSTTLEPGKSERFEFLVRMPPSALEKEYTGRVMIFKTPVL